MGLLFSCREEGRRFAACLLDAIESLAVVVLNTVILFDD
jgi:hypothetical protein